MSDDLDLRGIDARYEPNPQFRALLRDRLMAIIDGADPDVKTVAPDLVAMDLEPANAAPSAPTRNRRLVAQIILAAAAVVMIALVVSRDDESAPADPPSPTVTVPETVPATEPPTALRDAPTEPEVLAPGTYFVDDIYRTPTPRIHVTIGAGWTTAGYGAELGKAGPVERRPEDMVGFIMFSRPDKVYLDACHPSDGFHTAPVTTVDGLVAALIEQQGGWVDVTTPSHISVDGYPGKTFQRTVPTVLSDCGQTKMRDPRVGDGVLRSWVDEHDESVAGWYYEPGQQETLVVLDLDGEVVVINANLWAGSSPTDRDEFADVLDSIRIDPRPMPNVPSPSGPLAPATYFVDEVDGTRTPRISATLDAGWYDLDNHPGWGHIAKGRGPDAIGDVTFSNPVSVYADSCHPTEGFHPGPVTTVDEVVAALLEQQGGWVDVTVPADIIIDGYTGKAFQRTAPAAAMMSDCTDSEGQWGPQSKNVRFLDWRTANGISRGHEPGQVETLWILDLDGTVVIIRTELWPGPSAADHADFADTVLDSIRIEPS